MYAEMAEFPKPIVSLVQADALGGGAALAFFSDFVIAVETARFGLPEVHRGMAGGGYLMPRLIGKHRAAEMVLLGRSFSAQRHAGLGPGQRGLLRKPGSMEERPRSFARSWRHSSGSAFAVAKTSPAGGLAVGAARSAWSGTSRPRPRLSRAPGRASRAVGPATISTMLADNRTHAQDHRSNTVRIDWLLSRIAPSTILAVMFLIVVDVFGRYMSARPCRGSTTSSRSTSSTWSCIFLASEVLRTRSNIELDLHLRLLPQRLWSALQGMRLACVATVLALAAWQVWSSMADSLAIGEVHPGLYEWPVWAEKAVVALGLTLLTCRILVRFCRFVERGLRWQRLQCRRVGAPASRVNDGQLCRPAHHRPSGPAAVSTGAGSLRHPRRRLLRHVDGGRLERTARRPRDGAPVLGIELRVHNRTDVPA